MPAAPKKKSVGKTQKKKASSKTRSPAIFNESSKILVVGAGAVGGITAAFLARAGYDVEILTRRRDHARLIENEGLHIRTPEISFSVPIHASWKMEQVSSSKDIVFLAVKGTDLDETLPLIKSVLKKNTAVISMQNGMLLDKVEKAVGLDRAYAAVVGWGATMKSDADLEMTSRGEFILGHKNFLQKDEQLAFLSSLLREILPVRISQHIVSSLYSKLIINSCITSLGALTGWTLGELMRHKKVRRIMREIVAEAVETAHAIDLPIEPYAGKIDFLRLAHRDSRISDMYTKFIFRAMGARYRRLTSSSLQSLRRGQKTEVDFLNGYIVEQAQKAGVPVPINERIVQMLHEIESGLREISPRNLQDTMFSPFGVLH